MNDSTVTTHFTAISPLTPVAEGPTVAQVLREERATLLVAVTGLVYLFWPTLAELFRDWMNEPEFSHGLLVPVISGWILWTHREELGRLPARRSLVGFGVLTLSLLLFLGGLFTNTNILQRMALWGAICGGTCFVLGATLFRVKPFPFLFLLIAIPPPLFIFLKLRLGLKLIATRMSADILHFVGIPATPEGNVLMVADERLEVAGACSGVRSLLAVITTALLFTYLFRTGIWKGVLLVVTAIPITVIVNVIRITIVAAALTQFDIDLTHGTPHEILGLVVFALSLVPLYFAWRFYEWFFAWKKLEEKTT